MFSNEASVEAAQIVVVSAEDAEAQSLRRADERKPVMINELSSASVTQPAHTTSHMSA